MNLIQVINNEGITKLFIPICLDNFSSKQIAGLSIQEIPAIVISAENKPTAVYEGPQKCSQWLNGFIINRRKNLVQQVDQQRRLIQKSQAVAREQNDGPIGYTSEMDGISDEYSYTQIDIAQPKNFVTVGNEDNCIVTLHMDKNNIDGKIDAMSMARQIKEQEANRNKDTSLFKQQMEQNIIKTVVNNQSNNL
jgi:hypothetical protein